MKKKVLLFDELFDAVCKVGQRIRADQLFPSTDTLDTCVENCKKIACFIHTAKSSDEEEYRNARYNLQQGQWFDSASFRCVIKHMQLQQFIEGIDYLVELEILWTLYAHLGPVVYSCF